MWAYLLLPLAALAQPSELIHIEQPIPAQFIPARQAQSAQLPADRSAVRKQAGDWVKERATVKKWRSSGFKYVGDFLGKPSDDMEFLKYAVYRMTFDVSPVIGNQVQIDLLFYAQGNKLVWPREDWNRTDPPPGQRPTIIRAVIGNTP